MHIAHCINTVLSFLQSLVGIYHSSRLDRLLPLCWKS